jgi:hypothetical protein
MIVIINNYRTKRYECNILKWIDIIFLQNPLLLLFDSYRFYPLTRFQPTVKAFALIPIVMTLHTTACCSMPVVDITYAKYQSANITSLGVVQQKHSWSSFQSYNITNHIYTSHWSSSWVHRGSLLASRWTLLNLYNTVLIKFYTIQLEQLTAIKFVLLDYYYYYYY